MSRKSPSLHPAGGIGTQIPMCLFAWVLLLIEFAVYVGVTWAVFFQYGENWSGVLTLIALPMLARLAVVCASCVVSRVKGMKLTPTQRLKPAAWLRFFLVEYWHLCVQNLLLIPFRAFFRTRTERRCGPTSGPVLLMQHGYVNNGAVWFFTARALEARGYRVFTIDQPVFASIDTMGDLLADRVDAVLRETGASSLTLVAHSMGGLICRAYLRRHGGARVRRLITLGSPHQGTFQARLACGANGLQMRIGNPWLVTLAQTPVPIPFISIYSVHDTIISPQDSSAIVGADNVQLVAVGHVSMPSGVITRRALTIALENPLAREL